MPDAHHLFVCTSCRSAGQGLVPKNDSAGSKLFENLSGRYSEWAKREGFLIVPTECLSVCPRPCGIAMKAPGKYTYVYGDQIPGQHEEAIIECASLYRAKPSGFMSREERPRPLQAAILARIPPLLK